MSRARSRNNMSTIPTQTLNTIYVKCGCDKDATLLISYTAKNYGRLFYKCDDCGFWKWWDKVNTWNGHTSEGPTSSSSRSRQRSSRPQAALNTIYVKCGCDKDATLLISYTARNFGRLFYKCDDCCFWEWWDKINSRTSQVHEGSTSSSSVQCFRDREVDYNMLEKLDELRASQGVIKNRIDRLEANLEQLHRKVFALGSIITMFVIILLLK